MTDVRDDAYIVESFKACRGEPQPPVRFDDLQAPGGLYVLGFPTPLKSSQAVTDREVVVNAVRVMNWRMLGSDYGCGIDAYDRWIEALKSDELNLFGNAYNGYCWAEARRLAEKFLNRVASRNSTIMPLAVNSPSDERRSR